MRQSLTDKLLNVRNTQFKNADELINIFRLKTEDTMETCEQMFESKLMKQVRNLPRCHSLVLECILQTNSTKEAEVMRHYNSEIT